MAESLFNKQIDGYSVFGAEAIQGGVLIETVAAADKPSILGMYATSDAAERTAYYLWVDSNGDLRIHTAIPTDQDSDGTVVGTQT